MTIECADFDVHVLLFTIVTTPLKSLDNRVFNQLLVPSKRMCCIS